MFAINNTTSAPNQASTATLADGTVVTFTFIYRPAVQRWTVDVAYPARSFVRQGLGLSTHKNLLRLWRNVLPFGLTVATADGTDPFLANDLAYTPQGPPPRVILTVLDSTNGGTDVADNEALYFAAPPLPAAA